jgi:hypothetical protein
VKPPQKPIIIKLFIIFDNSLFEIEEYFIRIPTKKQPNIFTIKVLIGKEKLKKDNFIIKYLKIAPIIPPAPT